MTVIERPEGGRWYRFPDTCPPSPPGVDECRNYLVRARFGWKNHTITTTCIDSWCLTEDGRLMWGIIRAGTVTHWMMMPDPPEDEEDTDA